MYTVLPILFHDVPKAIDLVWLFPLWEQPNQFNKYSIIKNFTFTIKNWAWAQIIPRG